MSNDINKKIEPLASPGVFIDIDGVVLHGGKAFDWSKDAINVLYIQETQLYIYILVKIYAFDFINFRFLPIKDLWKNDIPFLFLTNGSYPIADLLDKLQKITNLPLTRDHIVIAPSPCLMLNEYHDKRVLVLCQNDLLGLMDE